MVCRSSSLMTSISACRTDSTWSGAADSELAHARVGEDREHAAAVGRALAALDEAGRSIRAIVWVMRLREFLTESASSAIRSAGRGTRTNGPRISYSGEREIVVLAEVAVEPLRQERGPNR